MSQEKESRYVVENGVLQVRGFSKLFESRELAETVTATETEVTDAETDETE